MNYAETLAYWYFRLNGFFVLNRFVQHKDENIGNHTDCDLLAIRHSHTYEKVGGKTEDWDNEFFKKIEYNTNQDSATIALIVEVKGGDPKNGEPKHDKLGVFTFDRLLSAVRRFGLTNEDKSRKIASSLESRDHHCVGQKYIFAKVLVYRDHPPSRQTNKKDELSISDCLIKIPLSHIFGRIHNRVKYTAEKGAGWNFYPNDLMQYLMWQSKTYPDAFS